MVRSIFLYIVIAISILASDAHICDVCECKPSRADAFSISCGCESTKYLQLTSSMMMDLQLTEMVIIKNCETVSVEKNSFSQLGILNTLGIQNCSRLYLATGAFANLNSLLISGVRDISFGEMAFMGARGVKNLNIRTSNITELPIYSFFDVTGMETFSLREVTIGKIQKNALDIGVSSLTIDNTKINEITTDGFRVKADKVIIKNSEINAAERGSIKITTEFQTRLLDNRFKNFQINITSPFAEFYQNTFQYFNPRVLSEIKMPRMTNNIFSNTTFETLFNGFNPKDFYDNKFNCVCNMNLLNYTRNSINYEILKKNFCWANCTLNLYEFETESLSFCFKDKAVNASRFCKVSRSGKSLFNSSANPDVVKNGEKKNITFTLESRFLEIEESSVNSTHSGCEIFVIHRIAYLIVIVFSICKLYLCG